MAIPFQGEGIDKFLKGIDTGSAMFQRMMQPVLERERLAQQMKVHQDNLGIHQQQQARLQQQWEQQQKENAYLQNLLNGGQAASAPTQKFGEGMGIFSPEGLQERQQAQSLGPDYGALKDNLRARGLFKKKYGFDPAAETPEDKMKREIETARQKEMVKQQVGGGAGALTPASKTKHQNVIGGVDAALPILNELIKDETVIPTGAEWWNPATYASYHGQVNSIIEPLIGAMGLNVTDSTKAMMEQQVSRRSRESVKAYKKRLEEFKKDLLRRRKYSHNTLSSGRVNEGSVESMSDEELQRIAEGGQ